MMWLLAGLCWAQDPAPEEAPEGGFQAVAGLPFPLYETTLENGLRVWVQPRPESATVHGSVVIRAGGRYETEATSGASHLLEHMLFVETEQWSEEEIKSFIEARGGRWNGITRYDHVTYWAQVPATELPALFRWLDQVAFHPTLPADELDREREVVFRERGGRDGWLIRLGKRYGLGESLSLQVHRLLYPGDSLGLSVIGQDTSLEALDHAQLTRFYDQHYSPDNAVLIVVGATTPAEVAGELGVFADATTGGFVDSPPVPPVPQTLPPTRDSWWIGVEDEHRLMITARAVGLSHPDLAALRVLADYLDEILLEELRQERGLVYSVSGYIDTFGDVGHFALETELDRADVPEARARVLAAIEQVREGAIEDAMFTRVKRALLGRTLIHLEESDERARWLARRFTLPEGFLDDANDLAAIEAVTTADLVRVANAYLSPDQRTTWVRKPILSKQGLIALIGVGVLALLATVLGVVWLLRRRR